MTDEQAKAMRESEYRVKMAARAIAEDALKDAHAELKAVMALGTEESFKLVQLERASRLVGLANDAYTVTLVKAPPLEVAAQVHSMPTVKVDKK